MGTNTTTLSIFPFEKAAFDEAVHEKETKGEFLSRLLLAVDEERLADVRRETAFMSREEIAAKAREKHNVSNTESSAHEQSTKEGVATQR